MLQRKIFEYSQLKSLEGFDDVDGRMRPTDAQGCRFEESKKAAKKKKVKMKKPKHSWFKVWQRRRWKGRNG